MSDKEKVAVFTSIGEVDIESVLQSNDRIYTIKRKKSEVRMGNILQNYIGKKIKILVVVTELDDNEYKEELQKQGQWEG